jgi:hypothetical protein
LTEDPLMFWCLNSIDPSDLPASFGARAFFVGLLRYKPGRGGVIKPEFRVDSVEQVGEVRLPGKAELLERWKGAAARPKRDLRAAFQEGRPRLVVITGVGSVAVDDIRSQLYEWESEIDLEVVRVSMHQPSEVVEALRQAAGARAVVLTRGGGEGVHLLDDDDLISAVASSPVPVAVALRHASDDLVLGRVADASFPTPTAFGAWLRPVIVERGAGHLRAEEAGLLLQSQAILDHLRDLQASATRCQLRQRGGEQRVEVDGLEAVGPVVAARLGRAAEQVVLRLAVLAGRVCS